MCYSVCIYRFRGARPAQQPAEPRPVDREMPAPVRPVRPALPVRQPVNRGRGVRGRGRGLARGPGRGLARAAELPADHMLYVSTVITCTIIGPVCTNAV
jgi:hypothetical protein